MAKTKAMTAKKGNKLRRVAIYIRVSTVKQKIKGESLETQLEKLKEWVETNDDCILVDIYIDGGQSGRKIKRSDFPRLMEDVKSDKIDLIIFTRLDRWFRNLRHYLNTNAILEKHECSWLAVNQPFYETTTPQGRAFVNQSMVFAQLEAENDGERIVEHNEGKVKRGEVLTGAVHWGWKVEDKHYVPSDKNHIITEIADYYLTVQSMNKTIQWLEDTYQIRMSQEAFKRMLTDERNKGCYRGNDHYCYAPITPEKFDRIQQVIKMNIKNNYDPKHVYIFSGLLICEECGHRLTGNSRSNKSKLYRCGAAYPRKRCINRKCFFESTIEKYMLANVFPELEKYIAEYDIKQVPTDNFQKKRKTIEKKIDRLKELYLNGLIDMNEYRSDKAELTDQLESIPSEPPEQSDLSHLKHFLKLDLESIYKSMSEEERRMLWRSIIKEIRVDQNKNISIIFLT